MLTSKAEKFVINLLNEKLNPKFTYHNIAHTQLVVDKATKLAELAKLDDKQKELLLVAAWLHDTGYTKNPENHEQASILIAKEFLKEQKCNDDDITTICNTILATKMGVIPNTLLEKILKDADCSHVGSKDYPQTSELLRKELELTSNKKVSESEWLEENINFLTKKHKFFTCEAASSWEKRKGKNLANLINQKKKIDLNKDKLSQKKAELKFKKEKVELPERGIETMFRVTLKNHITLSNIADTKANILLSVNAIIVSLVLSNLASKLDKPSNDYLIIPTIIFILFTVVSIILSIMATRPNVTRGKFTKEDVANKNVNLLFFGNFHKMSLNDFEWAMGEMMQDRDYLYSSMKKDLYFLGLVLDKKYKILRLTYGVFMAGIIISVIAFIISFIYAGILF